MLGLDLDAVQAPSTSIDVSMGEPLDITPKRAERLVRDALSGQDVDLSDANYRIVKTLQENDLTAGQTFTFMRTYLKPGQYKDEGDKRLADDIANIWRKNGRKTKPTPKGGDSMVVEPKWELSYTPASDIRTRAPRWLWAPRIEKVRCGRIAIGHLSLLAGREGAGKDLFVSWLIAKLTLGKLPGEFFGRPQKVAIVATEDSWAETIAPRLEAAGADMTMAARLRLVDRNSSKERNLVLPDDLPLLARKAQRNGEVLMVLNPLISAFSARVDVFKSPEIREILEEFRTVLERAGIAAIGIMHFNKTSGNDALFRIANARAFVEVSRAAFIIAEDRAAEESGVMILSQPRNNLGRTDLPSMAFRKVGEDRDMDDGRVQNVGKLEWVSREYHRTADDALADRGLSVERGSASSGIVAWVRSQAGREVDAAEVIAATNEKPETVRQALSRAVKKGDLRKADRGRYAGA